MINIIGAGPAGLYTAFLLAKKGHKVNVFEEHKVIGKPIQCTGITTHHLEKFIEIKDEFLLNLVNIARVYSNMDFIDFKLKEKNLIIDRQKFDRYIGIKAKKAGATIYTGYKFIEYKDNSAIFRDISSKKIKKIKTDILIGADGPQSKVSGLLNKVKMGFWTGIQARVKIESDSNIFETYFGNIAPKFFAWSVPENKKISRIGLAVKENPNIYFKRLLAIKNIYKKDILEYQGGIIPIYNPNFRINNKKNHIFLIGDAATQVKATTGGGIIPSLISAKILDNCIENKLDYQKEFDNSIGKDLYASLIIRKVLNTFSNKDFNLLIKSCKSEKVKTIIEEHDREFPSRFLFKLLFSNPKFLRFSKLIPKLLLSLKNPI